MFQKPSTYSSHLTFQEADLTYLTDDDDYTLDWFKRDTKTTNIIGTHLAGENELLLDDVEGINVEDKIIDSVGIMVDWDFVFTFSIVGSGSINTVFLTVEDGFLLSSFAKSLADGRTIALQSVGNLGQWTSVVEIDVVNRILKLNNPILTEMISEEILIGLVTAHPTSVTAIDHDTNVITISQPLLTNIDGSITPIQIVFNSYTAQEYTLKGWHSPTKLYDRIKWFNDGASLPAGRYKLSCLAGNIAYINQVVPPGERNPKQPGEDATFGSSWDVDGITPSNVPEFVFGTHLDKFVKFSKAGGDVTGTEVGFFLYTDGQYINCFDGTDSSVVLTDHDEYEYPGFEFWHSAGRMGILFHAATEGTFESPPTATVVANEEPMFRVTELVSTDTPLVAELEGGQEYFIPFRQQVKTHVKRNGGGKVVVIVSGVVETGTIVVSYGGVEQTLTITTNGTYTTANNFAARTPSITNPLAEEVVTLTISGDNDVEATPAPLNWTIIVSVNNLPAPGTPSPRTFVLSEPVAGGMFTSAVITGKLTATANPTTTNGICQLQLVTAGDKVIKNITYKQLLDVNIENNSYVIPMRFPFSETIERTLTVYGYDSLERRIELTRAFNIQTAALEGLHIRHTVSKGKIRRGITVSWHTNTQDIVRYKLTLDIIGDLAGMPQTIQLGIVDVSNLTVQNNQLTISDLTRTTDPASYSFTNLTNLNIEPHTPLTTTQLKHILTHKDHASLTVVLTPIAENRIPDIDARYMLITGCGSFGTTTPEHFYIGVFSTKTHYVSDMQSDSEGFPTDANRVLNEWEPLFIRKKTDTNVDLNFPGVIRYANIDGVLTTTTFETHVLGTAIFNPRPHSNIVRYGLVKCSLTGSSRYYQTKLYYIELSRRRGIIIDVPAVAVNAPVINDPGVWGLTNPVIDKHGYGYFFGNYVKTHIQGSPVFSNTIVRFNPSTKTLELANVGTTLSELALTTGSQDHVVTYLTMDRTGNLWVTVDVRELYRVNVADWPNITVTLVEDRSRKSAGYAHGRPQPRPDVYGNIVACYDETIEDVKSPVLVTYSGITGELISRQVLPTTEYHLTAFSATRETPVILPLPNTYPVLYGGISGDAIMYGHYYTPLGNMVEVDGFIRSWDLNTDEVNKVVQSGGSNPQIKFQQSAGAPIENVFIVGANSVGITEGGLTNIPYSNKRLGVFGGGADIWNGFWRVYIGTDPNTTPHIYPKHVLSTSGENIVNFPDNNYTHPTSTYRFSTGKFTLLGMEYENRYHPMWHNLYNKFDTNISETVTELNRYKAWRYLKGKLIHPHAYLGNHNVQPFVPETGNVETATPTSYNAFGDTGILTNAVHIYSAQNDANVVMHGRKIPFSECILKIKESNKYTWQVFASLGDAAGFLSGFENDSVSGGGGTLLEPITKLFVPLRFHVFPNV